jgi:hypothetical protein
MVSVRLPSETRDQLEFLAPLYGGNKTDVMIVAVAALYRQDVSGVGYGGAVEPVKVEAK